MTITNKQYFCPIKRVETIVEKESQFIDAGLPQAILRLVCLNEPRCDSLEHCPVRAKAEQVCSHLANPVAG